MVALWSPEFACVFQKGTTSRESFDATNIDISLKKERLCRLPVTMIPVRSQWGRYNLPRNIQFQPRKIVPSQTSTVPLAGPTKAKFASATKATSEYPKRSSLELVTGTPPLKQLSLDSVDSVGCMLNFLCRCFWCGKCNNIFLRGGTYPEILYIWIN